MTGKALDELDEMRTAPIAVTRHPHHLPRRPGDRECGAAGKTAIGIAADRVRRTGKRRRLAGEKLPGRRRRLRMLQWRQQVGSERARRRRIDQMFFLRAGRTGGEDKNSEQASDSAHQRLLFVATVALWAAFLPRSLLVRSLLARSLARYETARARRRYAAASGSLSPVTKRRGRFGKDAIDPGLEARRLRHGLVVGDSVAVERRIARSPAKRFAKEQIADVLAGEQRHQIFLREPGAESRHRSERTSAIASTPAARNIAVNCAAAILEWPMLNRSKSVIVQ